VKSNISLFDQADSETKVQGTGSKVKVQDL